MMTTPPITTTTTMTDLKDKSDKELLLMVREEIERIKGLIEELKPSTSTIVDTPTTPAIATPVAATTPTTPAIAATNTANTNADLPSLAS